MRPLAGPKREAASQRQVACLREVRYIVLAFAIVTWINPLPSIAFGGSTYDAHATFLRPGSSKLLSRCFWLGRAPPGAGLSALAFQSRSCDLLADHPAQQMGNYMSMTRHRHAWRDDHSCADCGARRCHATQLRSAIMLQSGRCRRATQEGSQFCRRHRYLDHVHTKKAMETLQLQPEAKLS